ncbi:MAG: hypothetical protein HQK51_10275 [Oligoflexia bacterium]|nr:hypothetical protein [Oligoflexia bacterium]
MKRILQLLVITCVLFSLGIITALAKDIKTKNIADVTNVSQLGEQLDDGDTITCTGCNNKKFVYDKNKGTLKGKDEIYKIGEDGSVALER